MGHALSLGLVLLSISLPLGVIAVDLESFAWHNRLLFLLAPRADDPLVDEQKRNLETRADALADRDMKVFQLFEVGQSLVANAPLSAAQRNRLRAQLDAAPEDKLLILIGKDGGIKLRAPLRTDLREVFELIDRMPMRRAEMREKRAAGKPVTLP
jgi:hypothetical protein